MKWQSFSLLLLPLWGFAQSGLLTLGDYGVSLGERGLELLWRGQRVISGSYLRLARPNFQGEDYLYFRRGEVRMEGNKMEVNFQGENGLIEGVYSLELSENGLLIDLSLKLNDPNLPAGPREYAVGMFPKGLVEGCEYELEVPLGRAEGTFPEETTASSLDYGPAFLKARIRTGKGFDILIRSLGGVRLLFHDARGSEWFQEDDRTLWIWAPDAAVGNGISLKTSVLLTCEEREEEKREGEISISDKGREIPLRGIVVPQNSPIERAAGKELSRYLEEMTGRSLPILEEGEGEGLIFVGKREAFEGELEGLKDDGFIIRQEGGNIFLSGKGYRGTIFAVYRFLESLGCKFLAREEEIVPKTSKLRISIKDVEENPAFEWRYFDTTIDLLKCYLDPGIRDEVIAGEKVPAVLGAPFFWHHPMNGYLPLEKYGETHPEYYCLIDGKRWPQLKRFKGWDEQVLFHPCVSNPDVPKVILETLLPLMASRPDARYFTVHAGDSDFWCQCENCSAMDVDPDNKADRMVQFTNAIGEVVAEHYPDKFVTMLAYAKAYRPPIKYKPRENVLVWFCPIQACQIHPWEARCNKENYDVLTGWIEKHPAGGMGILTFDYPMNYIYSIVPFPAMFAYLENLKLYQRLHIRGLYICGIPAQTHLAHLFSYVVPRMMWNPRANLNEYINDFLRNWFGPAAPQMKEYLRLLRELAQSRKADFNPWQLPPKELFTPEFLQRAYKLFEAGEQACEGNEVYLSRLWKEKAGILHTDLLLYGVPLQMKSTAEGMEVSSPSADQLKKLAELLRICAYFGWNSLQSGVDLLDWASGLLGYSPEASGWFSWWENPLMRRFLDDPVGTFENEIKPKMRVESVRLENKSLSVEILPSLGGRIRSIFSKKDNLELLWQSSTPLLLSYRGKSWQDFGGYEEYAGETLGDPGWKEKYEIEVSPDGQSAVLSCRLPKELLLTRKIDLLSSPLGVGITSTLRNEGSEKLKGVVLRIHSEFSFAMDGGPAFLTKDIKGEWRSVELQPQDNFLEKELFAGGLVAVMDRERTRGFLHYFDPKQVDKYMIYKGKDFYNLEIFSPKRDLAPGEEIQISHGYFLPETAISLMIEEEKGKGIL